MVKLQNKWKIDPKLETIEIEENRLLKIFNVNKFVEEKRMESLTNCESVYEREARNSLLNSILSYAKVCREFVGDENDYLLLNELWEKVMDELNTIINQVFGVELNGKELRKRKGESMEHYLMRCAILTYLNKKYGVMEFYEEYSKLKEVLRSFTKGEAGEREWEKVAKRADLYVILKNGSRLWIEIERDTKRFDEKIKRLKTMLSYFPDLFDKVVFASPNFLGIFVVENILAEAKEIGFPEEKLEFYEINLKENKIRRIANLKLVEVKFKDRIVDMIADGYIENSYLYLYFHCINIGKKAAENIRDKIKEYVIKPLVNKEWDEKYVKSKTEKIERLIDFWKKHTRKIPFRDKSKIKKSEEEVKFKKYALEKIKQNYPSLKI